jgi:hypothetical protein
MGVRSCAFCGASSVSAEHVWPRWLSAVLPSKRVRHKQQFDHPDGTARDREWEAPPYTQTVNHVCEECNNGWMSKLETQAKPLLQPMVEGRFRHLHPAGQRTIATWAFKTVAMLEYIASAEPAIVQEQRDWLLEHTEPHPSVHVWVAGCSDLVHASCRQTRFLVGETETPGFATTLSVGHFACQVAGSVGSNVLREDAHLPGVRAIWPVRADSFVCPPQPRFDLAGLSALHETFHNGTSGQPPRRSW